jgi:hypothetical protein
VSRRTWFAIVLGASVLPMPLLLLAMQSGLVQPSIPPGAWLHEPVLDAVHSVVGLPALASLCLLPALLGALAWALPAGLERLAAHVDPDDRAWTSFIWALRSWRGALRWLAIVLLPTAALVAAQIGLWKADIPVLSQWLEPDTEELFDLLWLSIPFFVLDARNLVMGVPPRRWSARWPTRQSWTLLGALLAAYGLVLLCVHGPLDIDSGMGTDTSQRFAAGWLGFGVLSFAVTWLFDLTWLSRAGWKDLPAVWRRGFHPRLLAMRAVQCIRPALYLLMAALPFVTWGWFLADLVPHAEEMLRDYGYEVGGLWAPIIGASRNLVAWGWVYLIIAFGAVRFVLGALWQWFGEVAWARLMVETGTVDAVAASAPGPTPATRPDCDPAATVPPTA